MIIYTSKSNLTDNNQLNAPYIESASLRILISVHMSRMCQSLGLCFKCLCSISICKASQFPFSAKNKQTNTHTKKMRLFLIYKNDVVILDEKNVPLEILAYNHVGVIKINAPNYTQISGFDYFN